MRKGRPRDRQHRAVGEADEALGVGAEDGRVAEHLPFRGDHEQVGVEVVGAGEDALGDVAVRDHRPIRAEVLHLLRNPLLRERLLGGSFHPVYRFDDVHHDELRPESGRELRRAKERLMRDVAERHRADDPPRQGQLVAKLRPDGEHWDRRVVEHLLGDRADERATDAGARVRTEDDQIGARVRLEIAADLRELHLARRCIRGFVQVDWIRRHVGVGDGDLRGESSGEQRGIPQRRKSGVAEIVGNEDVSDLQLFHDLLLLPL